MGKVIKADLMAKGKKFGIIVSRFNEFLSSKLLEGALDALKQHGAQDNAVDVVWVPGSFETPMAAQKLAKSKKYNSMAELKDKANRRPVYAEILKEERKNFTFIILEYTCEEDHFFSEEK